MLLSVQALAWNGRDCPDPRDPRSITIFRDGLAQRYGSSDYYGYYGDAAPASTWAACFPNGVPACVDRVLSQDFSYREPRMGDYPSTISTEARNPPDEFKAANGPGYVLPPNIEQLAQQKGWKTIKMKSRGSGGFDPSTNVLQLVFIPGSSFNPPRNYDQYLQFPLPADPNYANPVASSQPPTADDYAREGRGEIRLPSTMAMITMEKATADHGPRPYYQLWYRNGGSGNPAFQGGHAQNPQSCYQCHPNGMRAISPLGFFTQPGEPSLPPAMKQTVKEIRTAMSSYGNPIDYRSDSNGNKFVDHQNYGPPLGPEEPLTRNPSATSDADRYPTRTQSFIMGTSDKPGCAYDSKEIDVGDALGRPQISYNIKMSSSPSIRWDKIRQNMDCATCHNDDMRGALSPRVSRNAIAFKLLIDKAMPPGASDLTQDERMALYNCLLAEQKIEKKTWLTALPCTPVTAAPATVACPPGTAPIAPGGTVTTTVGSLNGASPTPGCAPLPALTDSTHPPANPVPAPSAGAGSPPAGGAVNPPAHP